MDDESIKNLVSECLALAKTEADRFFIETMNENLAYETKSEYDIKLHSEFNRSKWQISLDKDIHDIFYLMFDDLATAAKGYELCVKFLQDTMLLGGKPSSEGSY